MLVLSDIDGTVTKNPPIIIRMAEVQSQTGSLRPGYFERMIEHIGNYHDRKLVYEDFAQGLLNRYAEGLKGTQLSTVLAEVRYSIENGTIPLFSNISELIRTLQQDHDLCFVTASPQFIAQAISERFNPARFISSIFEVDGEYLTGRITSSLATRDSKGSAILEIVRNYPHAGSVALGDSIGDIIMLEALPK